jgi:hypothetical protein
MTGFLQAYRFAITRVRRAPPSLFPQLMDITVHQMFPLAWEISTMSPSNGLRVVEIEPERTID